MAEIPPARTPAPDPGVPEPPLKPVRTILGQEIRQAQEELQRPVHGIFVSALLAGIGVGASVSGLAHMLIWTTVGNAIGGVVFAVLIRYSLVLGEGAEEGRGRRNTGDHEPRRET